MRPATHGSTVLHVETETRNYPHLPEVLLAATVSREVRKPQSTLPLFKILSFKCVCFCARICTYKCKGPRRQEDGYRQLACHGARNLNSDLLEELYLHLTGEWLRSPPLPKKGKLKLEGFWHTFKIRIHPHLRSSLFLPAQFLLKQSTLQPRGC